MYNILLVEEKHSNNNYGYDLLFKTIETRNVVVGHNIIYEDNVYKIIDVDIVYKKVNGRALIKETNIYVEHIK